MSLLINYLVYLIDYVSTNKYCAGCNIAVI